MAISLPDARQLSDEVLQSLRLRALRGCELGYSEIEVAELLGLSRETVRRGGGPPTLIMAWKLSQATAPTARSAPGRTLNDGQAARPADDPQRKKPRGGGDRLPRWTRRAVRRVDPQGVRDRHAGADRRRVPRAVGLHGQAAAPSCQGSGPRGGPPIGWRSTYPAIDGGPPVRMRDPLVRRDRRGGRPATATGLRPRGWPARIEVPDPHIRMNLISTISNEESSTS